MPKRKYSRKPRKYSRKPRITRKKTRRRRRRSNKKVGDVGICKISKFLNKVIKISEICKGIDFSFDDDIKDIVNKLIIIIDKKIKPVKFPLGEIDISKVFDDKVYNDVVKTFDETFNDKAGGASSENSCDSCNADIETGNNNEDNQDDKNNKDNKKRPVIDCLVNNSETIKALDCYYLCWYFWSINRHTSRNCCIRCYNTFL